MTLPEQGQLVDVGQRPYVVNEVTQRTLPTPVLSSEDGHQHLISLLSVEDDALDEELQVVWERHPFHDQRTGSPRDPRPPAQAQPRSVRSGGRPGPSQQEGQDKESCAQKALQEEGVGIRPRHR